MPPPLTGYNACEETSERKPPQGGSEAAPSKRRLFLPNVQKVEAFRWDGSPITGFTWSRFGRCGVSLEVHTPAGVKLADPGNWIVTLANGSRRVLTDAEFEAEGFTEVKGRPKFVGVLTGHYGVAVPPGKIIPPQGGTGAVRPKGQVVVVVNSDPALTYPSEEDVERITASIKARLAEPVAVLFPSPGVDVELHREPDTSDRVTITEATGDYSRTIEGSLDNPEVLTYWRSLAASAPESHSAPSPNADRVTMTQAIDGMAVSIEGCIDRPEVMALWEKAKAEPKAKGDSKKLPPPPSIFQPSATKFARAANEAKSSEGALVLLRRLVTSESGSYIEIPAPGTFFDASRALDAIGFTFVIRSPRAAKPADATAEKRADGEMETAAFLRQLTISFPSCHIMAVDPTAPELAMRGMMFETPNGRCYTICEIDTGTNAEAEKRVKTKGDEALAFLQRFKSQVQKKRRVVASCYDATHGDFSRAKLDGDTFTDADGHRFIIRNA